MPVEVKTLEPKAALKYWRDKAKVTPREYSALNGQAKARAFTVAGLGRQDQINLVHAALQDALEKGLPLSQFKKQLKPLLEQKGWTGKKAWRIENIYRTNMQSAYMAGRYEQMRKVVKTRPYWRYIAVKDSRTRPTHATLNGKVYPHDHAFWDAWYPPNGYACRCTVQTLSKRQVEKRDYKIEDRIPRMIEPVDPRTGAIMPARPLAPDPGWAGNVGKNWLDGLSPTELEKKIKPLTARTICKKGGPIFAEDSICKPALKTLAKRHILPVAASDILPEGLAEEKYIEAFLGEFGLKGINASKVHELPGKIPVVIDKRLFLHKPSGMYKVAKSGREQYVKLLARTIIDPFEIWQVPALVSGRKYTVLRLLRLFRDSGGKIGGYAVFNLVGPRLWTGATAFAPKAGKSPELMLDYLERQRAGTLVYREP